MQKPSASAGAAERISLATAAPAVPVPDTPHYRAVASLIAVPPLSAGVQPNRKGEGLKLGP
jgi:hypothetical protein